MDEYESADILLARSSIAHFTRNVFPIVRPGTSYMHNWHTDCISEYLHAMVEGDIKRLIINIPPRSMKSISVSQAFVAWLLGNDPSTQVICASYSQDLAFKDSVDTRLILNNPYYKKVFPRTQITADQNEKRKFQTTMRGHRIATSVGGTIVGEGGNCILHDTPILTKNGYVPIQEIALNHSRYEVLGYDHRTESPKWCRVQAGRLAVSDDLWSIQTAEGRSIIATGEHPVFVHGQGYKPTKDLREGDGLLSLPGAFVRGVRGSGIEAISRPLSGLLPNQTRHCYNHGLRSVWKKYRAISLRYTKVTKDRVQGVLLQYRMQRYASFFQEQTDMRGMRCSDSKKDEEILLRQVYGIRQKTIVPAANYMPGMWRGDSAEITPDRVLRTTVLKYGSFQENAWGGQFALQAREELQQRIFRDAASYFREGFRAVCGVRRAEEKNARAPHQRRYNGQLPRESRAHVSYVSYNTPQVSDDSISMVERVCSKENRVYDLQVEGTSNFFAGEILVHNCLILDDPLKPDEAPSKKVRESTNDWIEQSFLSRENDPGESMAILVMQRLHMKDPTGFLLEKGGWELLKLPVEFTRKTIIDLKPKANDKLYGFHRICQKGELLFPQRWSAKTIADLKVQRGEYGFAGQYQQDPVPDGGGLVKKEYFKLWPSASPLPKFEFIVQGWDTAFTDKTTGDPTACVTFGVFDETPDEDKPKYGIIILDAWHDHMDFPTMRERVLSEYEYRYGLNEKRIDVVLVEDKGSGISLLQELQSTNIPAHSYNPGRADKMQRLQAILPYLEKRIVYLLESEKNPGKHKTWLAPFLSQVCTFPYDEHDDYVDVLSMCVRYLVNAEFATTLDSIEEEETPPSTPWEDENPYAA